MSALGPAAFPPNETAPAAHALATARTERFGLALLFSALLFNAYFLAPELWIGRLPPNDAVFHLAASERLEESLARAEPFLDPWVSEWSLGYPVWRSYQPLPHLFAALVLWIAAPFASHASAFAALNYLLILFLPASAYAGARLLGFTPLGAGMASLFVLAPAEAGDLGRYGLSYGATTWRGSGLFTQIFSIHFLLLSLGFAARSLDTGKHRRPAAAMIACAALSHIIFGYVAFVSAALLALVGPKGERSRRLARLATIALPALLLLLWFFVPLFLSRSEINHSRWEDAYKWDSFGASFILSELFSGRLLDAGRPPILSLLLAASVMTTFFAIRESLPRRLLVLTALWLALFFGRQSWGHLISFAGVPSDFHLHRLEAAFELTAVLLTAWGMERAILFAAKVNRWTALAIAGFIVAAIAMIGVERAGYLQQNASWGDQNLAAYARERADLEAAFADIRKIIAERPGRVSAGKAASWGKEFRIGSAPVFSFVTREHFDQASFLYHAMSITSDVMVLREEESLEDDTVFGVRAVIAPSDRPMPPHLKPRGLHGRFAVYEASSEGYFALVDIAARYTGSRARAFDLNAAWMRSSWAIQGALVALDPTDLNVPAISRWEQAAAPPALAGFRGRIIDEEKSGETYSARLIADRPCYALVKITWHPDLAATLDGKPASLVRVTPGFGAVAVPAGAHAITVRYAPGPLKPLLLLAGIALFALSGWASRRPRLAAAEEFAAGRLADLGKRLSAPRAAAALILAALAILSMRPLFRGKLIDGHDALEYPPRLVEMARALADGQLPPIWAPDLGNGHGQPLFEFVPPLVNAAAIPFFALGFSLADSLQIALLLLFTGGAAAIYRIGRRARASRPAALAGAAAWLFAPYVSLDLFVRAAFAEAAALAMAPVALLALLRALDRPSASRIAIGGAAVALVPLAHNGAALLILPALALVALLCGLSAENRRSSLAAGGATLLAGLGLSAYFWLPALFEKEFVKAELLRQDFLDWRLHAISPHQLLWSPWGYGLSGPGPGDEMSFALGPLHLLLGLAGAAVALRSQSRALRGQAFAALVVAVIGAWLATEWSAPVWSRLEMLQYLAYPWRALLLSAIFLPLLAIHAFERLGPRARVLALALLVIVNLPHTEPKGFLAIDDDSFSPQSIARRGVNTTTREEYEPRWVAARPPYTSERLRAVAGRIEARALSLKSARQEFFVRAESDAEVEAATFYYPGWIVKIDGAETPVSAAPISGTLVFRVPRGEHRVVLELLPTQMRRYAVLLTLGVAGGLALLALIGWLLGRRAAKLRVYDEAPWSGGTPPGHLQATGALASQLAPDRSGVIDRLESKPASVSFVIFVYNEAKLVESAVRRTLRALEQGFSDFELILIDDGSQDRTGEIMDRLASEDPRVVVRHNSVNLNLGVAIQHGLKVATKEFVVYDGIDLPLAPEDVAGLVRQMGDCDLMVLKRTSFAGYSAWRRIASQVNRLMLKLLFGNLFEDMNYSQVFRRSVVPLILPLARSPAFTAPEMILRGMRLGLRVRSVPVAYHARPVGRSSLGRPHDILWSLYDMLRFRLAVWNRLKTGSSERIDSRPVSPKKGDWLLSLAVVAALLLQGTLSLWSASRESATYDEIAHIGAGYSHFALGDFRLDVGQAPLPKLLAAAAIRPLHPPIPTNDPAWKSADFWSFGYEFLYGYGQGREILFRARIPFIIMGTLLGLIVFAWARELWGAYGGGLALLLCVFNPEILAHSHYANSDLSIALMITLDLWGLWRFLCRPTFLHGAWVALAFALAAVTKYSFIVLLPINILLAGVMLFVVARRSGRKAVARLAGRILLLLGAGALATYVVVWAVFGFRAAAASSPELDSPLTIERMLPEGSYARNLFTALRDHALLPEAYVTGLAYAVYTPAEARRTFLFGHAIEGGSRFYFPAAFLLKTPIPLLLLVVLAAAFWRRREDSLKRLFLLLPAVVYITLAIVYNYNIGYRHLLPLLPLLFIFAGRAGSIPLPSTGYRVGGSLLLLWYVAGAMWVAPHFLSYFNEIAGGASGGSRYLADSNIDWGQDLDELGRYCRSRGIVKIKLSYFGTASPETAGVPYLMLPSVTSGWKTRSSANSVEAGDVVAVSVTNLRRVYFRNPEDFPIRVDLPGRSGWMGFGSFLAYLDEHYRPFGRAGYSILIFKLTPEYER